MVAVKGCSNCLRRGQCEECLEELAIILGIMHIFRDAKLDVPDLYGIKDFWYSATLAPVEIPACTPEAMVRSWAPPEMQEKFRVGDMITPSSLMPRPLRARDWEPHDKARVEEVMPGHVKAKWNSGWQTWCQVRHVRKLTADEHGHGSWHKQQLM